MKEGQYPVETRHPTWVPTLQPKLDGVPRLVQNRTRPALVEAQSLVSAEPRWPVLSHLPGRR